MELSCKSRSAVALILALLVSTTILPAQSDNAAVSGVVRDPSGAMVPGARLVLTDERTGLERRAVTNESGAYIFTGVAPGFYSISAEATGFKTTHQTHNKIVPSIPANIDMTLQVGGVAETLWVTASVAAVQADSGTLGRVVDREQVENTQLNGRNPVLLAQLLPGVSGPAMNAFCFDTGACGANTLSVNGARPSDTMIYHDGAVAVRMRGGGFSIGAMDADNVQEIQMLTSAYSAEYGRASGGQIRMVTRSGGRDFHGSLFEFFRNSALDANSWTRNKNPDPAINSRAASFRYNQFGYSLSGPIYVPGKWNTNRNRLFFLWGQEYVRYRQDQSITMIVPSRAMREGDFGQLLGPNQFVAAGAAVKDPLGGPPFPANVIPQTRLSRNGIGLLRAYPLPTLGYVESGTNFYTVGSAWQNQRKDTVSIDFNPQDAHQIRFRHLRYMRDQYLPFDQGSDRTPSISHWPNQTASVNYVWTVSPTMINELLASASRNRTTYVVNLSPEADRTRYGIDYPHIYTGKYFPYKIPSVTIQSFTQLSGGRDRTSSAGPIYRLSDNLTTIHGKHSLKFGGLFERSGENNFNQIQYSSNVPGGSDNQNGAFTFTNTRSGAPSTGVAVANAALGLFDTYAEIGSKAYTPYRGAMCEWFAQDGWKASARLRLEFGIRHTMTQPYYSLWRNMIMFDPALYDAAKRVVQAPKTGYILSGQDFNGMVIPGSGWPSAAKGRVPIADSGQYDYLFRGYPKGFSRNHSSFQPRFGIAYQIGGGQVLRAGGGRFIQRNYVNDAVFPGGQAPFQPMVSMLNGNADNPSAGSTNARFPVQAFTQDRIYPSTEAYNWNVTYGRAMPLKTMLEVSYVGRRGLHNLLLRNINQLPLGTTYANPGVNPNYLRPYGGYYSILMGDPSGSSRYHSFQMNWSRRLYTGLGFGLAYTYSRAWDDGSDRTSALPNAYDRSAVWGPSVFTVPHIMVLNYYYALPFLSTTKSWLGRVAGGWSVSGVTQFQSGKPASVVSADDFAGVGAGSANQYWVMNGDPVLPRDQQAFSPGDTAWNLDTNFWFRTKAADGSSIFTRPAQGTFAAKYSVGVIRQPGFQNWNIGMMKDFRVTDRQKIRLRAEGFNWVNHPNLGPANISPTSAIFGKVSTKTSERALQFSLRYSF